MNFQYSKIILLAAFLFFHTSHAQDAIDAPVKKPTTPLFADQNILPLKMSFSLKKLRKLTNDSTYMPSKIWYAEAPDEWKELDLQVRVRGNFRKNNCYFTPIKFKIKKKQAKGTVFEGEKLLKLVVPCLKESVKNDNVIKELMAYKIYELISPYHFKTRMVDIEFEDVKTKRSVVHNIKGFLIEDDKSVAKRHGGKVSKRPIPPLGYDPNECVRNAMFQFMIGNTDWSATYQHNMKLMFVDKRFILVPYDFDMAGLVNSSYAVVSQVRGNQLPIDDVKQRLFVGYQRDDAIFYANKEMYLAKRQEIFEALEPFEAYFENKRSYKAAIDYLHEFYDVLNNEKRFERDIIARAKKHKQ
ncbi:MAG: hypothetical protein KJO22_02950 [Bacteroidia bacterium]|nr:hypothetical protein [Bacteroidia bacterium]